MLLPVMSLAAAGCSTPMRATADRPVAPVPVEVTQPTRSSIVRGIEIVATLEPWEEVVLYAKVSGYLKTIHVDRGDRVRQGDLLAVLDIPEMQDEYNQLEAQQRQAEAEVEKAKAEIRLQEVTANRLDEIRAEEPGATTQQEVDLAVEKVKVAQAALTAAEAHVGAIQADRERVGTMLAYGKIIAPFGGTVTERYVDPGALVTAGTQSKPSAILKLVNASVLRVMVDVPETEVANIQEQRSARLRVDAYPGRDFEGKVSRFSRALDPMTRTMRTEILVANPDGVLTPGMFGRVSLDLETRENVLTLAPTSIHFEKDKSYVFLAEGGVAHRVGVVCGADDGNSVEIVSGLTGRESVIAKASETLADGAPITVLRPGAK
jgi:RND family efflux transporter MFP subunit